MPHPVALAGFSTDPERYEAGRREYPDEAVSMLRVAGEFSPTAHLVASAAERLPFATARASMVSAAQAFPWFEAEIAWHRGAS